MNYLYKMFADSDVAEVLKSLTSDEAKTLLKDAIGGLGGSAAKLREVCRNPKARAALTVAGNILPWMPLIIDFAFICKNHGETKHTDVIPVNNPSRKIAYSDVIKRTDGAGVNVSFKGKSVYTYQAGKCIAEDTVPESFEISEELALAIIEALS